MGQGAGPGDRQTGEEGNAPALQLGCGCGAGPCRLGHCAREGEKATRPKMRERDGDILFPFLFCKLNFPNSFKCSFETFEFQNKNQTAQ
jgi:hypothetical protein